ncbi:MAG TPA: pseudouridine synthase [Rhabdochlamydiaceae bacterium]|nr:pseudouridine synthase [Rhabdochlamydiaceae bacterium]
MEKNRLSKILAQAGVASRRSCEEIIFSGRVKVNGKTCLVPQTPVSLKIDDIRVDEQKIQQEEKKVYYILNKPVGYICSSSRTGMKKIVLDLFEPLQHRLFTIGRLDRDTSGLLLVTNDGHFAHKVIHPSSNISKEYLVKVQQEVGLDHLESISKGAFVEEKWVKPLKVSKLRRGTLKIIIKEGRKREVRLLVEKAGLEILELKRIRIGGLTLGNLAEGAFRPMTENDKEAIFSANERSR